MAAAGPRAAQAPADGRILFEQRKVWRDGTTHLRLEPLELLEKPAALIPRPEAHLLLYHGVLAPHAAWRQRGSPVLAPPQRPPPPAVAVEVRAAIGGAIAQLPDAHRIVFVLRDVDGVPNQEVAQLLGLSIAAVKSRLHRARLALRHQLAEILAPAG